MPSYTYTADDVARLTRAIADGQGARSMSFGDQTVVFNSLEDMEKQRARMIAEINAANGTRPPFRVATTSKGV
jgi:hypothetical protein